jgi:ATP/maltotriose-dependent transcriptional regulator MalT
VLEQLARENAFVQRVDETQRTYRYHRLFANFLADQLRAQQGAQFSALEHRARLLGRDASARLESSRLERAAHRESLSERELEVAALMAEGLTNQEIAQRICVAPGTVKRHVHNIFGKLNVRTRAEAIACTRGYGHYTPAINRSMYP